MEQDNSTITSANPSASNTPILTFISTLGNHHSVKNHILQYYSHNHRDYLDEPKLYDILVDVLTNVAKRLEQTMPNCLRTTRCMYWPSNFEVGYPVQGSSGLGFKAHDYTDEIVATHKYSFLDLYVNFDQFSRDIFNLFNHW
jgi:hypothetical protein